MFSTINNDQCFVNPFIFHRTFFFVRKQMHPKKNIVLILFRSLSVFAVCNKNRFNMVHRKICYYKINFTIFLEHFISTTVIAFPLWCTI